MRARTTMAWRSLVVAIGASTAVLLGAPASHAAPQVPGAVRSVTVLKVAQTPLGSILVTSKGRTVYLFAADSKGVSRCDSACADYWPPVVAPATLPAGVPGITGRLGVLKRSDGIRQLTINGLPLYTYKGDAAKGQTSGQGVDASGAKWWVVSPSGARITKTASSPGSGSSATSTPGPTYDY